MNFSILDTRYLRLGFRHVQRRLRNTTRKHRTSRSFRDGLRAAAACNGAGCIGGVVVLASTSPNIPDLPFAANRKKTLQDFGHPLRQVTDGLLVLNLVVFGLQWLTKDAITVLGAKVNSLVLAGQWWRLITPAFLHSGVFHLLINSYALHSLGPQVEAFSGPQRFLTIYLVSAVAGTAASVIWTPAPSVGASAAIFGVGAALGMFYWRHRDVLGARSDAMLQSLSLTLIINAVYTLVNKRIDQWGHLGGMVAGAAAAWALGPRFKKDETTGKAVDRPPLPLMASTPRPLGGS